MTPRAHRQGIGVPFVARMCRVYGHDFIGSGWSFTTYHQRCRRCGAVRTVDLATNTENVREGRYAR